MSDYQKLLKRHIELIEDVNNAKNLKEVSEAFNILEGFRDALYLLGIDQRIDCDLYYTNQGIHRAMFYGVFID